MKDIVSLLDVRAALEIAILFLMFYTILVFIRGTRAQILLKGIIFLILFSYAVILTIANFAGLIRLQYMLESLVSVSIIGSIIIFAPEIRRALMQLAHSIPMPGEAPRIEEKVLAEIAEGIFELADNRTGALIAIERKIPLDEWVETGERLEAECSAKLIESVFYPGSPLHDGGAIIKGNKISSCACTFPISESATSNMFDGMRHKAALGLSEETDAVCIAVSEELGKVTLFVQGKYTHDLDKISLIQKLNELFGSPEKTPLAGALKLTRRLTGRK